MWGLATTAGINRVAPGRYYRPRLGSLMIDTGVPGNEIHIDDFNPDDPMGSGGIEFFQFDDGTYTSPQLLAKGFEINGTPDADVLGGTALGDRIAALGRSSRRHGARSAATHDGCRIRHASGNRKFAVRAEIFLRSPPAWTASGDSALCSMP